MTLQRDSEGAVRTLEGRLAGSVLTLDAAVRSWVAATEVPLPEAIAAACDLPRAAVGLPSLEVVVPQTWSC